ncbi:hypothetical protein [Candidatus Thiosymbion oneisti]|uniref:hypothetical protein n=1 Tax=Candidatus Thiosymbion oneisti TaxID=589554 RepID=UPI000A816DAD|nr:hypothetical protein [Candidatus Thiosymbion oneisti]
MRILFDQGTPVPLRNSLIGCKVSTVFELGWERLRNGDLIRKAEKESFEILITTDKNLKYQQNLSNRKISILVLSTTSWARIKLSVSKIQTAIENVTAGSYDEINLLP